MTVTTIATRGSKLALWQAHHVRDRILATDSTRSVELLIIKTKGDKILDVPLAKVGGKGLFVKEIEQALLDSRADLAVHSMKDVPAALEPGLHMAAISEREDSTDALVSRSGANLAELPEGAVVGTSSLRRQCQLRAARPDIVIKSLRGNVPTRLGKLDDGEFDAIVLASAGLVRLGFAERITQRFSADVMLSAVGQGALGIETRADDQAMTELIKTAMHHEADSQCIAAERAFLARLEGGCQAPLAAHARHEGGELAIEALVGTPDGTEILRETRRGAPANAEELGREVGDAIAERGGRKIIQALIEASDQAHT